MAKRLQCPQCGSRQYWMCSRNRRRCAGCRADWVPGRLPLRLVAAEWQAVVRWFLLGLSAQRIGQQTGLERRRVLRALRQVRRAMARDVPPVFGGTVEVDETYLGGRRKVSAAGARRAKRPWSACASGTGALARPSSRTCRAGPCVRCSAST